MKNVNKKTILKVVIPLVVALLSICVISKHASSVEFHKKTIESLDEKKTTVMELTAASTVAATTITLLPDDTATPIAEKLTDLSGYFLIVLAALYLEKYLLTITGYAAFTILIPAACVLLSASVFWNGEVLRNLAKRLALFGLAIFLVIPTSIKVSDMIEATYDSSIQETLDSAKKTTEEIEKDAKEDQGIIEGIISKVKDGISGIMKKIESVLNNFIEALAVMIVTSCVIPMLVLVFFVWIVKVLLGVDIKAYAKKNSIKQLH